jgi:hypothetical protein
MPFPPDGKPPTAARLKVARLGAFRLAYAPTPARLTQATLETLQVHAAPLRATQIPVEVLAAGTSELRLTQAAVEVQRASIATLRLTQGAVEVFLLPPPCFNGAFPIDSV